MSVPSPPVPFRERLALFSAVTALWFIAYFGSARLFPPEGLRVLTWDPVWRVPYVGAFTVPYTSAYVMPLLLLAVPCDQRTFRRIVSAFVAAIIVSAPMFVLLPLLPPRVALAGDGLLERLLALQYRLDVEGNCFPSLHVSLALLTALSVGRCVPERRIVMLLWAALVAVSTVFVRQHYVVDAVAGAALAFVIWRIVFPPHKRL